MEPVNNSEFQVLNCPANDHNFCGKTRRYCYDATFCPVKQQIIYNWALLGIYGHFNTKTNRGFHDLPQENINLLNPYPYKILKEEDSVQRLDTLIEFRDSEI